MSDLKYPDDLLYTKEHTWARLEEGATAHVGITDFAQDQLGEVVYVELPDVGASYKQGAVFGTVESIKTVNNLFMPFSGKVLAVNKKLADDPSLVNASPYSDGWMLCIAVESPAEKASLLNKPAYEKTVAAL